MTLGGRHAPALAEERETDFAGLIDGQLDRSYRIARLILRNEADAEDATHDAVVTAWRQWHQLRDRDRFEAWFGRILVNRCRDRLRRVAHAATINVAPSGSPYGQSDMLNAERRIDIGRAFDSLNPDQRIAVVLRYWTDLTVEQIAERMRVPVGTVKSRLHHALKQLRTVLERSEVTHE